jgi:hypothetical protein
MTPITASLHLPPAGEPRFRRRIAVAPPPPTARPIPSIRLKLPVDCRGRAKLATAIVDPPPIAPASAALRSCGTIVWETKNTRHWHAGWLDKLKEDQRAIGANLAVIASTALPDGIVEFGRIDGVWVAGLRAWPALAVSS